MKNKEFKMLQLFAAETGTTVSADLAPAISVDFTSRIAQNIVELQELLGITDLIPMSAGTDIKIYKWTVDELAAQVGEAENIGLTHVKRELANTITLDLDKYRRNTSAESIQKVGRDIAINQSDEKLVQKVQKGIKGSLYTVLKAGTGTATGANLQKVLANLWAKLQGYYEDEDVTPVYFVNQQDVADYLGTAQITMQTAFGFTYIENFLGLGTAIISPQVTAKKPIATAKENLRGAYVPMSGDVAQTFGLIADTTGLVGMTHSTKTGNATVDTLLMSCVKFFPEFQDGVFIGTISGGIIASDILTIPSQGQTLYGKRVSSLIGDDVKVYEDGTVTGTFKHVTGYTGFNADNPAEQEGYYFPFKLAKTGANMTFRKNGAAVKEDIPWEADNVFRVTASDTFEVLVDGASVVTFNFAQATFLE